MLKGAPTATASATPAEVNIAASTFATATGLHQRGNLGAARQLYRAILGIVPEHFGASRGLGVIWGQLLGHAARQRARSPDAQIRVGVILAGLNRPQLAMTYYQQSLIFAPAQAEVYNNIGAAHHVLGRFEDAYRAYEQAIALTPEKAAILPGRPQTVYHDQ